MTTAAEIAPRAPRDYTAPGLDREIRDVMTPGVIAISEGASVQQARRALLAHRVHAVLVIGQSQGRPLGWVTARGLLGWAERDDAMASAREAITEPPATISPSASARDAMSALLQHGVSHLLVQPSPEQTPEGVVSELDLLQLGSS